MTRFAEGVLIGESDEQETEFYSASVVNESGGPSATFVMGLCSQGHGLTPQLLVMPAQGLCLFGLNNEVVAVNVEARKIKYRVNLGFLFRTMVPLPELGLILVLHETGVKAIFEDGGEAWSFSRDVIEHTRTDATSIRFSFLDSDPATLDLITGKELVQGHHDY